MTVITDTKGIPEGYLNRLSQTAAADAPKPEPEIKSKASIYLRKTAVPSK